MHPPIAPERARRLSPSRCKRAPPADVTAFFSGRLVVPFRDAKACYSCTQKTLIDSWPFPVDTLGERSSRLRGAVYPVLASFGFPTCRSKIENLSTATSPARALQTTSNGFRRAGLHRNLPRCHLSRRWDTELTIRLAKAVETLMCWSFLAAIMHRPFRTIGSNAAPTSLSSAKARIAFPKLMQTIISGKQDF